MQHRSSTRTDGNSRRRGPTRGDDRPFTPSSIGAGDARVVQVRSKIGATKQQLASLQALRLGRIGHQTPVDLSEAPVRGLVHSVRHLVEVRPLSLAGERWSTVGRSKPAVIEGTGDDVTADVLTYEAGGNAAIRLPLSDGAYFNVEVHRDSCSLAWTSLLPLPTVLDVWADIMAGRQLKRAIVLRASAKSAFDREIVEPSAAFAELQGERLGFVRLELDGVVLTWEMPRLPKHVDEPIEAGEVGLAADVFDEAMCITLLERTGTVSIGENAATLVKRAGGILTQVERGELLVRS